MKKTTLVLVILSALSLKCNSQILFENGYFIDESNKKTDCLIKNVDWKNNPSDFEYRLTSDDSIQKATITNIKEFGINGVSKYTRAIVKIDRSSDYVNELTTVRNPVFQEEQLFLKVLIDGKASLYSYFEGNLNRFFYRMNDSEISQLVYKRYLVNDNIGQNTFFRQQIFTDLTCADIRQNDVDYIQYNQRDLERIFIKYNACTNSQYTSFVPVQEKKDIFNLSIRPGINYTSLHVKNHTTNPWDIELNTKINFRLGIEAEYILPFNKNKWSVILEPTFQYYKTESTSEQSGVSGNILVTKVNYKSIETPVGIRYYFFLSDQSKVFLNASYIFDFDINSGIKFLRNDGTLLNSLDVTKNNNVAFGIGYKLKNRYSIELRYFTSRDIIADYELWESDYSTFSFILGYSFF